MSHVLSSIRLVHGLVIDAKFRILFFLVGNAVVGKEKLGGPDQTGFTLSARILRISRRSKFCISPFTMMNAEPDLKG